MVPEHRTVLLSKSFSSLRGFQISLSLNQAAQGSGGVTISGGVQKMCRCGTSGHDL